jgi:hypothetical protein
VRPAPQIKRRRKKERSTQAGMRQETLEEPQEGLLTPQNLAARQAQADHDAHRIAVF